MAIALLGGLLRADVVYLKNGRQIEGRVTYDPKERTYTIERGIGALKLPEDEVLRIERRKAPADEFEERFRKLPEGELESLLDLALWARGKRLRDPLQRCCRRILELDSNNEMARRELGYVVFDNTWVLERELRQKKGLVKFRGEWMEAAERDRRQREEARRKIADLFKRVNSENPYIRRFAVEELLAYKNSHARGIFALYLDDSRELIRLLAVTLLTNFPVGGGGRSADSEDVRITAELYRMFLTERSKKENQALYIALLHFYRAEAFRLAIGTLQNSEREAERRRAARLVHQALRKAWVPTLCRALVTRVTASPGNPPREVRHPAIRDLLKAELGTDQGPDPQAWLGWWAKNQHRFDDSP